MQLFAKIFSRVFFAIFLFGSLFALFGFGGIGKIEVRTAVEEGYFVSNCTSATCQAGKFTECKTIAGGTGNNSFCKTSTDVSLRKTFLVAGCTTAGTCKDGTQEYTGCNVSGVCTVKNGALTSQIDGGNGWKCDVSASGNISKCTTNGQPAGDSAAIANCVSYKGKTNGENKLSCVQKTLGFGKEPNTATYWKTDDGGFIFKTSDGKSYYATSSSMGTVCNGTFSPAPLLEFNGVVPCIGGGSDAINNFDDFKKKLVTLDSKASDIIGSNKDIKVDVFKSEVDLTSCTIATQTDLDTAKVVPKTGELWRNCGGKIVLINSDGTAIKADGTKLDSTGAIITGEIKGKETTVTDKLAGAAGGALGALFNIILTVISFIILALTYFAGWLAVGALWILGYLFLIFLRINPAGANFISVAVDPWRIVVGIANMFVLSTFIFVGFGYILDIAKLKVKIEDFLLKIILFTLVLNFTLLGSASIVNVTQGIGEIMVGAYSIGETDPQKANFALINGLIEGMSRASVLRCGNIDWAKTGSTETSTPKPAPALKPGEKAAPSASESATGKDCDFGITGAPGGVAKLLGTMTIGTAASLVGAPLRVNGKAGSIVSITIMELVFLAIACFAVVQFWKALALVLGRTIGLWLLIVASPLALAAYISPIEGLKKYASQWLDHFWKWCLFYPAFIFCLILINIMSRSFSDAASAQVNNLANNTNGIVTSAIEIGGVDAVNLMLFAILGVVPMFLLSATVDYFAKSFEAIAKMTLGAAKTAWNGFKGAATTMGGGISALGNAGANLAERKFGVAVRKNAAKRASELEDKIKDQDDIINSKVASTPEQFRKAPQEKARLEREKAKADAKSKAKFTAGLDYVAKGGEAIAMAPLAMEHAVKQAKYHGWDKWVTNNQAQQAGHQEKLEAWSELKAREKADTQEKIDALDKNPLMNRFIGQGKDSIAATRAEHIEDGKTGDPYTDKINGLVSQKIQDKLANAKTEMDQSAAIAFVKFAQNNWDENVDKWTEGQKQAYEKAMVLGTKNQAVGNVVYGTERGQQIAKKLYDNLSDKPEAQAKIAASYAASLPTPEARYNAGRDIASNWANIKDIDLVGLDQDTIRGIIENKGNIPIEEIYARTGKGASTPTTNKEAKRVIGKDSRFVTENAENKNTLHNLRELSQEEGFTNQITVQRKISKGEDLEVAFRDGYKNEYGTDKYDNIEAGLAEIKGLSESALLVTDKGAMFAEDSKIKSMLAGTVSERSEAIELIRRGIAESFYSTGLRLPQFKNFVQKSGEAVKKGKDIGEKAGRANAYAASALKQALTRAGGDNNQINRELDKERIQRYLGAADLGKKYSSQVVSGDVISVEGIASEIFSSIRDSTERSKVAAELTDAIAKYADTGIDTDLQALSSRLGADISAGGKGIEHTPGSGQALDIGLLKNTIKEAGKESVDGIRSSGQDLLASVKSAAGGYDSDAQRNNSDAMEKSKIFDTNLASRLAGVYKQRADVATVLEPARVNPRIAANNIVPFERDISQTVLDSTGRTITVTGKAKSYLVYPVGGGTPTQYDDENSLVAAGYNVPR